MKRWGLVSLLLPLAFALGTALGWPQEQAKEPPSLGDLAKQLKTERAKATKSPKVFTNDNLPARPEKGNLTVAATMSSSTPATAASPSSSATPPGEVRDEKYYRERMDELRAQKDTHERELAVLQKKLGQNNIQFYPDPNKQLMQEYSRSDINKLTQDIEKKKQQVAEDDRAMDGLRDQLRREGGPSGWLR